jgi:hypothetical protein
MKTTHATGFFVTSGGFVVSVKGLGKRCPTDFKTVYPGSIPGVASKSSHRPQHLQHQHNRHHFAHKANIGARQERVGCTRPEGNRGIGSE